MTTPFPIRVDVTSADRSLRIVDTFLFDPSVWPQLISADPSCPLPSSQACTASHFIAALIRRNCDYITERMLEDTLVIGVGRTARHFTGRLSADVFGPGRKLHYEIANQIFEQIWAYFSKTILTSRILKSISIFQLNKRALQSDTDEENLENDRKKNKLETETLSVNETKGNNVTSNNLDVNSSALISIRIRLSAFGYCIQDDFDWDPTVPVSPLEVAYYLSQDLNLTPELELAVAIDIAEQIWSPQKSRDAQDIVADESTLADVPVSNFGRRNSTAAWQLDPRTHISNITHLVHLHQLPPSHQSSSVASSSSLLSKNKIVTAAQLK